VHQESFDRSRARARAAGAAAGGGSCSAFRADAGRSRSPPTAGGRSPPGGRAGRAAASRPAGACFAVWSAVTAPTPTRARVTANSRPREVQYACQDAALCGDPVGTRLTGAAAVAGGLLCSRSARWPRTAQRVGTWRTWGGPRRGGISTTPVRRVPAPAAGRPLPRCPAVARVELTRPAARQARGPPVGRRVPGRTRVPVSATHCRKLGTRGQGSASSGSGNSRGPGSGADHTAPRSTPGSHVPAHAEKCGGHPGGGAEQPAGQRGQLPG